MPKYTAKIADKFVLYQEAVQSPDAEVFFIDRIYKKLYRRPAIKLFVDPVYEEHFGIRRLHGLLIKNKLVGDLGGVLGHKRQKTKQDWRAERALQWVNV